MSITTEQLSAFLDNELSAAETEQVRRALEQDEELAAQLAALVMVDDRVRQHVETRNETPIPSAVTELLRETDNKVVQGPWQKLRQHAQQHVAMAASVALVVGVSFGSWLTTSTGGSAENTLVRAVEEVLESKRSGTVYELNDAVTMTPQLTFQNHQGNFCRHYELYDARAGKTTAAIQCRRDGSWQPIAEATRFHSQQPGSYQTASGRQMLDAVLDSVMNTAPYSRAAEDEVLNSHWKTDSTLEE